MKSLELKIESEPSDSTEDTSRTKGEESSNTITRKEKIKQYNKTYYANHLKKCRLKNSQYYISNKERLGIYRKKWREENREKLNLYFKSKKASNPNFRIACSLRVRMSMALKQKNKSGSAVSDLGCSMEEFRVYLSSKFSAGMTWENYGEWHIDHISPLSKFNLSDRAEFLRASHFSNLQPLWAKDNLSKSDK